MGHYNPTLHPEPLPIPEHTNAVKISIGSDGREDVSLTIKTVRLIIGHAVGSGVVDNFVVLTPGENEPIPVEGGFSACAEGPFQPHLPVTVSIDNEHEPSDAHPDSTLCNGLIILEGFIAYNPTQN